MMLNQEIAIPAFSTKGRDFDTIQNAIKQGMNCGHYGSSFKDDTVVWFKWRLMGDIVETLKQGDEEWKKIDTNDLTFCHRLGVFAYRTPTILGFIG